MGTRDKRVDAYIDSAEDFARPVLSRIREVVHKACPGVQEEIKWGMPYFIHHGMLCGMAAFKAHCALGFWRSSLLPDPEGILESRGKKSAMGQLGRITGMEDLPPDRTLIRYIRNAAELNEKGVAVPRRSVRASKPVRTPAFFRTALKSHPAAERTFKGLRPGQRREYTEWLAEAKTEETRRRRLATAIAWLKEGKPRNWMYMKRITS